MNISGSIDGFGTKRLFGLHVGLNQNPSKSPKSIPPLYYINRFPLISSTHSPPSPSPPPMIPLIGVPIAERLRDRGFDCRISFDDSSKHPRPYRQIPPSQNKIPSRDAYPSDVPNIHSPSLERVAYGV